MNTPELLIKQIPEAAKRLYVKRDENLKNEIQKFQSYKLEDEEIVNRKIEYKTYHLEKCNVGRFKNYLLSIGFKKVKYISLSYGIYNYFVIKW